MPLSKIKNETVDDDSVKRIASIEAAQSYHEIICAERYAGIISRISRMEIFLISAMSILISGMGSIIWNLIEIFK